MEEDTGMSTATTQHGIYDGGVSMIEWCQNVFRDAGFAVVDYGPIPVTPPATPPPVMTNPAKTDNKMQTVTESLPGVPPVRWW
jgi:hypothetical protein